MATKINTCQEVTLLVLTILAAIRLSSSSSTKEPIYITKSYFDNHDNFAASKLIDHDLGFDSCHKLLHNVTIKSTITNRHLIGEGSHRRLSNSITFQTKNLPNHSCRVVIVEKLPDGVFADPFELQDLHQHFELPLHARYQFLAAVFVLSIKGSFFFQPLDESGYTNVEFGEPDLLMHCIVEAEPDNRSCLFNSTLDRVKSKTQAVVWKIPSGMKTHSSFVSVVTFISAILSTLSIVWASVSSSAYVSKSTKQL
ncbi:hypothetical protein ACFE04_032027 [Oxalis oulophora]